MTSATIFSGVFSNPAPTLQYSGISVRAAPPSRAWIGSPAALPMRSHSAMSMTPANEVEVG